MSGNITPQNIPIEEEVDYNVVSLRHSKYELNDGAILRVCLIPHKVYRTALNNPQGIPEYLILWTPSISVINRNGDKGPPSPIPFDPSKDPMTPIESIPLLEPTNVFELSDGSTMKVRVIVERAFKTEKRDSLGEIMYYIVRRPLVDIIPDDVRID